MEDVISLEIRGVWVRKGLWPKRAIIVRDASLKVEPGEFVAIVGPTGAGKTTLLKAIGGEEPFQGEVLINGEHLYNAPEFWLPKIGHVRSERVLHQDLRVSEALKRVGQLRLPEISIEKLTSDIKALFDKYKFPEDRRNARLKDLSTGQRKYAEICAELLTEPALLLLDEPTSGLDAHGQSHVMQQLENLASSERRTVLAVIHEGAGKNVLDKCHRVIFMARGGVIVWDGPPGDMQNWAEETVETGLNEDWWAALFRHFGPDWKGTDSTGRAQKTQSPKRDRHVRTGRRKRSVPARHQFGVLLRRYWSVMCGNPLSLILNILIGALGGLFLFVLQSNSFIHNPGEDFSRDIGDARNAIFFVALVVVLIGLLGSFREIVKESHIESPIYNHERLKGLSPWAYLLSKWVLLTGLIGIVAPVLLMTVLVFVHHQDLPSEGVLLAARPPWLASLSDLVPAQMRSLALMLQVEGLFTLILACVAALALGLVISAFSSNPNTVTGVLALVVIMQLVLSGLIQNESLKGLIDRLSVFATSRWAIEGFSTNLSLYCWTAVPQFRDYYSLGHLFSVWFFLIVYTLVALAVAYATLRLKEPFYSKWKALWSGLSNKGFLVVVVMAACFWSWGRFLKVHAQEYFQLRTDRDVRIEDVMPKNLYQTFIGHISQSQCPTPVPLPSPPPPVTVEAPTPENGATPSEVVRAHTPTPEPTPIEAKHMDTPSSEPSPTPTPSGKDTPTLKPPPTAISPEPTATATFSPTPAALSPLPEGQVQTDTQLQYGPEHTDSSIASVPPGVSFVLLGKDRSEGWYRVKLRDHNLVGWLRADMTNLIPRLANAVAAPPKCAKPRTFLQGKRDSSLVMWKSDVDGSVAAVVDLYREQAGEQFPRVELQFKVNGSVVKSIPIPATRQSFLLRGTTVDANVRAGDSLEFFLRGTPADQEIPSFFATVFFVPDGCSFEGE
jgi:ABC-type multidrug transport system ATPase subunit